MTPPVGWRGTVRVPSGALEVEVVGYQEARTDRSRALGAAPDYRIPVPELVLVRCAERPEVRGVVASLAQWETA